VSNVLKIFAALGTVSSAVVASFLSHLDGTDTSTTITDEYGNACTAQGNAQIDTAASQFGGASLELDGTGDYVSVTSFADKVPGTADWIIECFVKPDTVASIRCVSSTRNSSTTNGGWAFNTRITEAIGIVVWDAAGAIVVNLSASTGALSTAAFTHVGVLKIGTTWGLLSNGAVVGTATETGNCGSAGAETFKIGRDPALTARDFDGHIDEVRIVKGAEVSGIYPNALTSMTYTVPTSAFEAG